MTYIQYLKRAQRSERGGKKAKNIVPHIYFHSKSRLSSNNANRNTNNALSYKHLSPKNARYKTIWWLSCCLYISFSLSIDYSLIFSLHISFTLSCHISNKPAQNAHTHPPHIHQISSYRTDTQSSPITGSVEDGCHGSTSRAMLPHDQKGDAAEPAPFLCSAPAVIKKDIITGQRKEINYYVTLVFRTPYMKQL